jgi:hypothetical protein
LCMCISYIRIGYYLVGYTVIPLVLVKVISTNPSL